MTGTFLRAPPFPGPALRIMERGGGRAEAGPVSDEILHLLASERIGGAYWMPPTEPGPPVCVVVRCKRAERGAVSAEHLAQSAAAIRWFESPPPGGHSNRDAAGPDPWSVLASATRLVAHGDDEWVAIAALSGVAVELLSDGAYGRISEGPEAVRLRLAQQLATARYFDPFTGLETSPEAVIAILGDWRRQIEANRTIATACGMAWWKHDEIRRFLWLPERQVPIRRNTRRAIAEARKTGGKLAVWPSRIGPDMVALAGQEGVELVRIEDGFIRSAGLGSDLVPPSSVVVDHRGIHFDPSGPSDLEHILAHAPFPPALLARAQALCETIVAAGISKYAASQHEARPDRPADRRVVLVAAQVEDDMSVVAGGGGIRSNLEVLRRARACEPDADIWYRPHPDIEAGHRLGAVDDGLVLQYADRIVREGTMASLLDTVDAVHVLTSLTGFEALLRGKQVTCHGTPFYAGWGLTIDQGEVPARRGRQLTLDQLVAGVLILYPRYLDPVSRLPCPVEVLVARMAEGQAANRLRPVSWLRRWQGRFMARWR